MSDLISPTDEQVIDAVHEIHRLEPGLGRPKVLAKLKATHKWSLSEARLKKIMVADMQKGIDAKVPRATAEDPNSLITLMTNLFNGMNEFPPFPEELLKHNDGSVEEVHSNLPPPTLPKDAFAELLRYREGSIRGLRIYGRGKFDFGITPNSNQGIYIQSILDRVKRSRALGKVPNDEKSRSEWARNPSMMDLWEFYEVAARKAKVSRADIGRQFEAEFGVNMHLYHPERRSDDPEVSRQIEQWEAKRAARFKELLYPVLTLLSLANPGQTKKDRRGMPLWNDAVNGQFVVTVTRIDRSTGKECGDI